MTIGISGPIAVAHFVRYLSGQADRHAHRGLGGTQVNHLGAALLAQGHRVIIFTLCPHTTQEVVLSGEHLTICIGPYRPTGRLRAHDFFRTERTYLSHAIVRERPDIVHAHWTYEFALGALQSDLPTLITVRDWAPTILRLHPSIYRVVRLLMAGWVFGTGSRFVATSPYIQTRLTRWLRRHVPLIPNAVPDEIFYAPTRQANAEAPLLISINNGFGKRKNVHTLLIAFAEVRRRRQHARLALVGRDYEEGGAAHWWARQHGLDDGVSFVGEVPYADVLAQLRRASLLVHPALEESFGNTLVEAMAQGTPVIGGRESGAVPWVLGAGEAGTLVDVTRPEVVAQAVIDLLDNPGTWSAMSRAGKQYAHDCFRLSATVRQYEHLYEDIHREALSA